MSSFVVLVSSRLVSKRWLKHWVRSRLVELHNMIFFPSSSELHAPFRFDHACLLETVLHDLGGAEFVD